MPDTPAGARTRADKNNQNLNCLGLDTWDRPRIGCAWPGQCRPGLNSLRLTGYTGVPQTKLVQSLIILGFPERKQLGVDYMSGYGVALYQPGPQR
jgi:hypothetical protein